MKTKVRKKKSKMTEKEKIEAIQAKSEAEPTQQYDASLKDLIEQQAADILPLLLPGVEYERTLNVEMIRPAVRADKIFLVRYKGDPNIMHLEFESGADPKMDARMLAYNSNLYLDYGLPVISILIYPFKTTIASTPLIVTNKDGVLVHFNFQVLPLFTLDAETYVRAHATCMYPLLPTMEGVTHELMQQVMHELAELHREDEKTLVQQYGWIKLLLERSGTVPSHEKEKIMNSLDFFDYLWNTSPTVNKIKEESEAKGALQTSRKILVNLVKARFPGLTELAQHKAAHMSNTEGIELLIEQIGTANDENVACRLLSPSAA